MNNKKRRRQGQLDDTLLVLDTIEQLKPLVQMPDVFSNAEQKIIQAGLNTLLKGLKREIAWLELQLSEEAAS